MTDDLTPHRRAAAEPGNCVMTHATDPDRPRRAIDGAHLCPGHRNELERLITEMPHHAHDLDRPTTPRGGGRSNAGAGINIDDRAATLRPAITATLVYWAAAVAEIRGITPPRSDQPRDTAAWLANHIDWLAAQPRVDEMLYELRDLTREALRIIDLPARRVPLGQQCLTHTDGQRCQGHVTLVVRGDDWTARCDTCTDPQDAIPYLRAVRTGAWITRDEVILMARRYGVAASPEVVWQWKHRRRIVGRTVGGELMLELASVQTYLARRTNRERMTA